ncbi:MAG: PQQ-dependent sugar dehydrogenase [Methyloceanibacter sp.]
MPAILITLCLLLVAASLSLSRKGSAEGKLIETKNGQIKVETVARGLDRPWAFAFLPDGRMLVTEKRGRLRIVAQDGTISKPVAGVPEVIANGQGGLLDVALDPAFAANGLVYLAYSEAGEGGAGTAVARGTLGDGRLENAEVIFQQKPKVSGGNHFGSRLAFSPDGKLFVTLGDRFKFDPAQDLASDLGKVVRINPDGSIPSDNPFVGQEGKLPEIWSYGHRNPQGAAIHPVTGKLWEAEFGPFGGDELNIPEAGKNYGWPVVSWGKHYDGTDIPDPPEHPEFADAVYHWNPVISPSGIAFYTADLLPGWKDNLILSGLSSESITRLELDGEKVVGEERIELGSRIRDVAQGPDGALYALTDAGNGRILKLTPAR